MSVKIRWFAKKVKAKARKGLSRNLDKASIFLVSDISRNFPGAGRSQPGKIPHVDTGHLKRNVGWERKSALIRRIGSGIGSKASVGYAAWLEFGTVKMAARPWLRPGLKRNKRSLRKILSADVV